MPFWFALFLFIGTTVLSALLQKRPKDAQPSSLGDFTFPTAQEGRAIPVIFGTVKMAAPNVVWYGDLSVDAIKKKGGGMLGLFGKKVTVGYKYFVGMQMALCHGSVNALVQILADDTKDVPHTQTPIGPDQIQITIDQEDLFGGVEKEGGLSGTLRFYLGTQAQPSNAYLTTQLGLTAAPNYFGLCHVVAEQIYVGTSQFMKKLAFVMRRTPSNMGLASGITDVNGDANPAEIVYEAMINQIWGLGIPAGRIDLASFQAAATTLATEQLVLSMQWDSAAAADQLIGDVLRHMDAVLYTDPATGLWTLTLARLDYNPATLPELAEDDLVEAPEFSRGSWEETLNEIKVSYIDRTTFKERVVQAQETANFAVRGELSSESINFLGFSNATIAQTAAMRELKAASFPLVQARLKANRIAWNFRIGGVFKLTWPPYGISGVVFRITAINYGALEQGEIIIDCVEDIFAVAFAAYTPPTQSAWVDPISDPLGPSAQHIEEVPYHLMQATEIRALIAAVRADGTSRGYQVWTSEDAAAHYQSNVIDIFTPSAVLQAAYLRTTAALDATGFVLEGGKDLQLLADTDPAGRVRGDNLLLIDNEWISWETVLDNGDGTFTFANLVRGIFDTLPADHAFTARVWFISDGSGLNRESAYPADLQLDVRCLPFNSRGVVDFAAVADVQVITASRSSDPYPPGNVKVNGIFWPVSTVGDALLTWAHRHRTQQADVVQQDAGNQAAAPEGDYDVDVLVGGVVKRTFGALTGTSQIYTAVQRFTDDANGNKTTVFRLFPINGVFTGTVRDTDPLIMSGLGMALGLVLGGANA